MKGFIIFLTLLIISFQKKNPLQKVSLKGDHFFSEKVKTKTYVLEKLQQNKPLLVFLKQKNQETKNQKETKINNKVTIKIFDDRNNQEECELTSYQNYCALSEVKSKTNTKIKLTCEKTPCDITFESLQAESIQPLFGKITLGQTLYTIEKKNPIITIFCNDSSIKQFSNKFKIYTNNNYRTINQGNLMLYIFEGLVKDLVLLKEPEVSKCVNIKFQENKDEVNIDEEQLTMVQKQKQIQIKKIPTKQLRIDLMITEINKKKLLPLNVTIYGIKDTKTLIQLFLIRDYQQGFIFDSNLILKKKKFQNFTSLAFKITTQQPILMRYTVRDVETHQMDIQEQSFFSLDKDQEVKFNIIKSKENAHEQIEATLLQDAIKDKVNLNLTCSEAQCKLQVLAKQAAKIGISINYKHQKKNQQQYITVQDEIKLTLKQGEIKYLIHKNSQKTNKIISVSSRNVLMYAAGQKCPLPSDKCFQFSGDFNHMMNIQQFSGPLYIAIQALELVSFVFRIADRDQVFELSDGVPILINMQKDKQIVFKFRLKKKMATNFNLIAPPGVFNMFIVNSEEEPQVQDLDLSSSSNYIRFQKQQIDQLVFTILIQLKVDKQDEHFTIIASTNKSIIALGRSEPHYDLIKENEQKYFSLILTKKQIEQKVEMILSVDIFQKLNHYDLILELGKSIKSLNKEILINKGKQSINIHQYTQDICDQEDDASSVSDTCFLYFKLSNHNSKQLDVTLNVLTSNSIIELTSGLWQSYQLSTLTGTNHFYFIPTNAKNPIFIMFSHTYGVYKINYILFNNKGKQKNAGNWPFPLPQLQLKDTTNRFQINQHTIEVEQIKKCFPNCILLVSLQNGVEQKSTDPNIVEPIFYGFGTYSIMATDYLVQIIESQKIPIALSKQQVKLFTIPITQALKKNKTLTFLTADIVGYRTIYADITTNRLNNFPTLDQHDFQIIGYEFQITTAQINQVLAKKDLDNHQQIDLLLYVKCFEHCKFLFQFTTKQDYIQPLSLGIPNTVTLQANSQKIYSIYYYVDYKIKITRTRGFPIIIFSTCKYDELKSCFEDLQKKQNQTMISKTNQIQIKHIFGNVDLLRISSKQQNVQLEVVVVAKNSAIQLKEGTIMTDFLTVKGTNFYKIHTTPDQTTIITVTVFEGNPNVTMKDLKRNIVKSKSKKVGNIIQFYVHNDKNATELLKQQSENEKLNDKNETVAQVQSAHAFPFNLFSEILLQVTDNTYNASYSVVYTLGQRHQDIIDGVIASAKLRQDQTITYNYINEKNSSVIVTVTFMDSEMLNNCQITLFSYSWQQQQQPVESKPQKLKTKTKTPKPSITFELDALSKGYEIKLKNKKSKTIQLLITINHADLIYLPFSYQYPNYINANQTQLFVIQVMNKGYVEVIVKKCSLTDLTFSYGEHDSSFINDQYAYTQQVQQNRLVSIIKAEYSSIYLKLQSQQGAVYSITANKYDDKKLIPPNNMKAGDKGQIIYNFFDDKIQIEFTPVVCKKQCAKILYYYMMSEESIQVNNQIACPGNFFLNTNFTLITPKLIKYQKANGKYKFKIDFPDKTQYLGIKAVAEGGKQVSYRVIQIQSIWQGFKNNSTAHLIILFLFLLCFTCILCIACRRQTRSKTRYNNLPDMQ